MSIACVSVYVPSENDVFGIALSCLNTAGMEPMTSIWNASPTLRQLSCAADRFEYVRYT